MINVNLNFKFKEKQNEHISPILVQYVNIPPILANMLTYLNFNLKSKKCNEHISPILVKYVDILANFG